MANRRCGPAFEQYLLYDERGNYACLAPNRRVRYFQAVHPEDFSRLYSDRNATIQHFSEAFAQLRPGLPTDEGGLSTAEHSGMRLIRNPLSSYERSNLKFVQGGFGSKNLPEAGVVRSFNVLIYFDAEFRREAEKWAAQMLQPGGLFVCGRDDPESMNAHYSVYRRRTTGWQKRNLRSAWKWCVTRGGLPCMTASGRRGGSRN
jgi:hypothetical protein